MDREPIAEGARGIAGRIREEIVDGRLFPNERLVEEELAKRFGVNRATIRVALTILEQQGLVTRQRHRGASVRAVTDREAVEIFEIRSMLESLIARHAAMNATGENIRRLRRLHAELSELLAGGKLAEYQALNVELHAEIVRIAQHPSVANILQELHSQTVAFQYRPILEPGRAMAINKEHKTLIEALSRKDPDAAEAAMRRHLDNAVAALRQAIAARRSRLDRTG